MVLFNWIHHRRGESFKEIAEKLGYDSPSYVSASMNFRWTDGKKWFSHNDPILMSAECFLWDWQKPACDFLTRYRLNKAKANKVYIHSIISDISGPAGQITEKEANKWSRDVENSRKVY